MSEETHSNEVLILALLGLFNAQKMTEEEFGPDLAEHQRTELLDGLRRQQLSFFSLRSIVTIAAMKSQNEEALANPIVAFERLIGEKIENIAAS